ncbi:unnamed protein product [Caretta caretta]
MPDASKFPLFPGVSLKGVKVTPSAERAPLLPEKAVAVKACMPGERRDEFLRRGNCQRAMCWVGAGRGGEGMARFGVHV